MVTDEQVRVSLLHTSLAELRRVRHVLHGVELNLRDAESMLRTDGNVDDADAYRALAVILHLLRTDHRA